MKNGRKKEAERHSAALVRIFCGGTERGPKETAEKGKKGEKKGPPVRLSPSPKKWTGGGEGEKLNGGGKRGKKKKRGN